MSAERYAETLADVRGMLGPYCTLGTPDFERLVDTICKAVASDAADVADGVEVLAGAAIRDWRGPYGAGAPPVNEVSHDD